MKLSPDATDTGPIPWARPTVGQAELDEVIACMRSGWLSSGPRVERFERAMADRAGRRHGIAVTNGTAALDLALRAVRVTAGDEVVVPALSYIATASAVALQGATPVFADVDRRNLGLDPDAAAAGVSSRTAAVLCTDHGGNPCDYAALTALADRHGLPLILDGAQSIGATFAGRPCLSYGLVSTTSFHAAKTMTTVEGGMVFTDDDALARRMRIIRSQGEDPDRKYHHVELGHNFRMTELQAAIGLAQVAKLDDLLADRHRLAARYRRDVAALGLTTPPGVAGGGNSYFLFSALVPDRDRVAALMKQRGIETRVCYPVPLYEQPIFQHLRAHRCEAAEAACAAILNPPMFYGMTDGQQHRVTAALGAALQQLGSDQFRLAV